MKNKFLTSTITLFIITILIGCGDKTDNPSPDTIDTSQCKSGSVITKVLYRPLRSGILRETPNPSSMVVVNKKYKEISGKEEPITIDGSEKVFEQCTLNNFSFVSIAEGHRKGIKGWVESDILKKKLDPNNTYEGKISEYIYDEREPDYFEGLEKFKSIKPDIRTLEIKAAEKVIDSGKCEHVNTSMIDRLSDKNSLKVIVYCENMKQFTLTREEVISSDSKVLSNTEKSLGKEQAIILCKAMIKDNVLIKSSVNTHDLLGTKYYQATTTGNVSVTIDFDAKNALGATMKYSAKCIFPIDEQPEITFKER